MGAAPRCRKPRYHAVYEKFSASNDENTTQTHATTGTSPHRVCAKSSAAKGRKIIVPIAMDSPVMTSGE